MSYMMNSLSVATILIYVSFRVLQVKQENWRIRCTDLVICALSILIIMSLVQTGDVIIKELVVGSIGAVFMTLCFLVVRELEDSVNFMSLTFYESLGICAIGPLIYFILCSISSSW